MKNIQSQVRQLIENNLAVRKLLKEDLVNVRALARKFLKTYHLDCSMEAVISAIRRYDDTIKAHDPLETIYKLLKNAKLTSRMKLCALLIRKNRDTRKQLFGLVANIDYEGGDVLRIFEVTKYFKVISDQKLLPMLKKVFKEADIIQIDMKLSELTVMYESDITKIPGLFAMLSNELGANDVSIVDSMICHDEHIIIISEKDTKRAFDVVFDLLHR